MHLIKQAHYFCLASTLFIISGLSAVMASSVYGGAMTLNIDSTELAAAFSHSHAPNRPSFYLEEYFNANEAASRNSSTLLTDHLVPGTASIPSTGLELAVNNSSTSVPNIANSFSFDPNNLAGTAFGQIGLGGALRYRLNIPFSISDTGEEEGNRAITAFFSLEYDINRVTAEHSGWAIYNHHSFRAPIYDLDNVITTLTDDSLTLTGDLALASGFNHMGGTQGAIVGDFTFQTTVVPVPAAVWLFASGLAGLFVSRHKKQTLLS